MLTRSLAAAAVLCLVYASAPAATQGGPIPVPLPLFPPNNWWNTDVSAAPIDPASDDLIAFIQQPYAEPRGLHPDFGGDAGGGDVYGFPFIQVDASQPKQVVSFVAYPDESDGVGVPFYPIPDEAISLSGWVEGGQPGNVDQRDEGDRHILIVDTTNNHLYELYNVWHNGTQWEAGSGAFFDMNTNDRRPEGWTSADAAGLAILPGLVRYDEVHGEDEIRHALRVTVRSTNGHVYPASHTAGATAGALPMGARLRLKAAVDISSYPSDVQKIFRAFKKYGLIVADNGSDLYVSGAYDTRWDNGVLNPAFRALKASDFEVVQLGWQPAISLVVTLPEVAGAGDASNVTVTAYDQSGSVATGYAGTVQFTSSDGSATLPTSYTFTAADSGTHTFASDLVLRTAGLQIVTTTDVTDATITGSRSVVVGPSTPTALAATASSPSVVNLTWTPVAGAAQYEILRRTSGADYAPFAVTAEAAFVDSSVTAGAAYVYRVRAVDAFSRRSPLSAPDHAVTILFTDDPLVARTTVMRTVHIAELRQAAAAMRTAAGLVEAVFADATLTAGSVVKAIHITEARTAIAQARAALGLSSTTHTDGTILAGVTLIKAAHVEELRAATR